MVSLPGAGDWAGEAMGSGEEESAHRAAIGARSIGARRIRGFLMEIVFVLFA
jgi:hypothetical protein